MEDVRCEIGEVNSVFSVPPMFVVKFKNNKFNIFK